MSTKARLLRLFGSLVLTEAEVLSVSAPADAFRLVELRARGAARWQPGDKVQVLLPSDDVRTYTPLHWGADGATTLLVYLDGAAHGDAPGSRWARQLAPQQRLRFVGPQRSLMMPPGELTLIGDETSFGVAAAYAADRPGKVRCVFEVEGAASLDRLLHTLGLGDALIVRREAGAPRGSAVAAALPELGGAHIGLTGGAALIQAVRTKLRERGAPATKIKTYWIEGRAGLD
jgi:NADPH-dependent ferric siderophore reductase